MKNYLCNSKNTITFVAQKIKYKVMKVVKCSKILSDLNDDGWYLVNYEGSHRQFKHPTKQGKVTVNGKPSTDFWGRDLKSIEKQSGLIF
jgi:predicted RNA binding protein YcfA (HicA-like mRNA interferase family)